ncbi:hypothetical protein CRENBAI_019837 [Crenichthys baileyi]|uniref:Cyclin-dependent kinase 5 activator n=1 Tax=Crenichthys baileyi TaxID=28760 RepID=A0AAV9RIL7_9TELE
MGTLLSLSPSSRSTAAPLKKKLVVRKLLEVPDEREEKKKRYSGPMNALRCKKRLMALGFKKKVDLQQAASEGPNTGQKIRHRSIHVAGPTIQEKEMCIRRVVFHASTGELLRCLSDFLRHRCVKLKEFPSNQIIIWFRNVDRALLLQGWQNHQVFVPMFSIRLCLVMYSKRTSEQRQLVSTDPSNQCFINPSSLVFIYLLCRDMLDEDTASQQELHATFLTCLYLAYSYLGNEISYPTKPFLVESSNDVFWERALEVIEHLSADMLRLNAEPSFFTEVFHDLKRQGGHRGKETVKKQSTEDSRMENLDR